MDRSPAAGEAAQPGGIGISTGQQHLEEQQGSGPDGRSTAKPGQQGLPDQGFNDEEQESRENDR